MSRSTSPFAPRRFGSPARRIIAWSPCASTPSSCFTELARSGATDGRASPNSTGLTHDFEAANAASAARFKTHRIETAPALACEQSGEARHALHQRPFPEAPRIDVWQRLSNDIAPELCVEP